jgi:serine/threonine protein kinase
MAAPARALCPDENLLVSLIEGRLPEAAVRALEDHVDACPSCESMLGELALVIAPVAQGERPANDFTLGRYQVLGEVGAGAMGVVYAALDPDLGRKVALKLLRPDLAQGPMRAAARARLLREARLLAGLSHPNVLSVYEAGVAGDQVFIAVELIEGHALDTWNEGAHPWRRVAEIYAQAARGLAAAHQAGLVHRDVKPANLMLGDDGRVRVTDFGLATAAQAESSGLRPSSRADTTLKTQSGAIVGTPAYMAPEQLAGRRVDARSDQFSFAVALGEALVGERPIAGASVEDLEETAKASGRDTPPRRLYEIVSRGLRARAAERFGSMADIAEGLELLLADARPAGAGAPDDTPKPSPAEPAVTTPPPPRTPVETSSRSPRLLFWGALGVAALGGAWLVGRQSVTRPADVPALEAPASPRSADATASSELRALETPSSAGSAHPGQALEAPSVPASPPPPVSGSSASTPSVTTPSPSAVPASSGSPGLVMLSDDDSKLLRDLEWAHDGGDGATCLKKLAALRSASPTLGARADVVVIGAQCAQLAGDCARGRRELAAHLEGTYRGAALDDAVDASSIPSCRSSHPPDVASPEFQGSLGDVQALLQEATAARTAKDVARCRAVGEKAQALAGKSAVARDERLRAQLFGVTSTVTLCLVEAGDAKSCAAARAQFREQYKTLYPEIVAKGLDDQGIDSMFHSSYPSCP